MKFRGEFQIENLHHFVGCLLSFRRLAAEVNDGGKGADSSMNAVIRITPSVFSVVAKTTLLTDAVLEISMEDLFLMPCTLETGDDGIIALNVSVNSLYETLNAAVSSGTAALKLKRDNQTTSLSVAFPDPAFPSISITLDIAITPLDSYEAKDSLIPDTPACTVGGMKAKTYASQSNVGITKFQGILCYLESANKIGNELTEFELCPSGSYIERGADSSSREDRLKRPYDSGFRTQHVDEGPHREYHAPKVGERFNNWAREERGNSHSRVNLNQRTNAHLNSNSDEEERSYHHIGDLKLKSPGLLADLETVFYGVKVFSSHRSGEPSPVELRPTKTVLRTDAVYTICKNAMDSILFNKHQAMLVVALPDDYLQTECTYFVFSVLTLASCQMVFMIPNQHPDSQ